MKVYVLRALSTVLLLSCSFYAAAAELKIIDPWVRAAPPNAPALGVFMTLENHSGAELAVVAARTSLAVDRVELHRTMMVGDVMKMVPQQKIPVAPHSATVLKPGSWHVMLIAPEKVPAIGDKLQLTLVLGDGSEQGVEAVVRKGKKGMKGHDHQMKHDRKCNKEHEKKYDKDCKKKYEMDAE
jgi:copper(I)-binding protein